jgi:TatA/E family protein of Tat protein translocase
MPSLGPTEIILVLLLLVLLFGAKRLPDTARGIGRSLRIFKAETKGLRDDDDGDRRDADHGRDRDDDYRRDVGPREVTGRVVDDRDVPRHDSAARDAAPLRGEHDRTDR